ncbi:signal peptidase I [Microbacterium sp. RU33B]|uniref:signal peptidase I n=1 Tax=Microbacterium sp. RU33B TaxID=1907390 RepID=UPI000962F9B1|nr:signal peptidase I [Microbacterium sp. RU33B]SIT76455.1 signal peptidase, endoplasmic reticulum-type [Microbacterium sp. RU33B]
MNTLRRIAMIALWTLAGVGVLCGVVWGATAAGVIKPLIVISGSMEPGIMTGDLLIATKTAASDLEVGDVVSLPSELTDKLVTHRIVAIEAAGDGYLVTMKGDNNEFEDALDYSITGDVWKPEVQVPGAGSIVMRATTPAVAVPLLIGLVALLGLTLLLPAPEPRERTSRRARAQALNAEVAR